MIDRRVFLFALFSLTGAAAAVEPAPLPESTPWDVKRLSSAPQLEWLNREGKVHSLKYRGEDYKGRATSVFAWYASPATLGTATQGKKAPGIVLVHGGGGTAFSQWAELWAKRGYTAIAMDLAGRGAERKRLEDGGPDQSDDEKFGAIDGPITDQWTYHAVANVILAHSLLRSFDEVDVDRTALTGISWGGYLTCIVAGLDQRFQVAMPVYGCGFLRDNSAWTARFDKMQPAQAEKWHTLWDPSRYIGSAKMPVMFLNGTNDFAYPLDSYSKTCALVAGEKNYSIQLRMRHGHIFDFPEFFLFVDQYIKGATPLPVVSRPTIEGGKLRAEVKTSTRLVSARLHFTTGPHRQNPQREWTTQPLVIEDNSIRGNAPPAGATVWYVDVTDERKALVSSEVVLPTLAAAADEPVDADVLLKGATIYDGSSSPPTMGDVAIRGENIIAVGTFRAGQVGRRIDCTGLVVAPGFIDLHNHSDRQVVASGTRAVVNYLLQGCTTIVTGNCGSGPVDVGEYYDKIDAAGAGTNVAHLLPQGNLRSTVVGHAQRSARAEEIEEMKKLAAKAMHDGAWGMSTGLIYVPSSYADAEEIAEISKAVSAAGGIYVSHIRNENVELLAAVNEAMKIGRTAGMPVHISHFKSSGRDSWGLVRRAADMIEAAQKEGQKVTADQYPYIASSTSLDATLIPTWARAGGRKELIARLDDPESSARIRQAMQRSLEKRNGGESIQIARYAKHPEWAGKRLSEIARAEQIAPLELAIQISRSGGAGIVNFSMDEADVRHVMQRPWVATASDGRAYLPGADKPHPRSYGTFARKLGHYAIREKVLPLERAIHSSSGLPAEILGLTDRGYLRTGMAADVVVFDPKSFIDRATFAEPHRYSAGVRYVFVNGRPAVFDGQPTGALAGRALRKGAVAKHSSITPTGAK